VLATQHGLDTLKGDVTTVTRALGRVSSPVILVGHCPMFRSALGFSRVHTCQVKTRKAPRASAGKITDR
jgi:hypothetical protein